MRKVRRLEGGAPQGAYENHVHCICYRCDQSHFLQQRGIDKTRNGSNSRDHLILLMSCLNYKKGEIFVACSHKILY